MIPIVSDRFKMHRKRDRSQIKFYALTSMICSYIKNLCVSFIFFGYKGKSISFIY